MQALSDILARGSFTIIICFGIIAWFVIKMAKQNPEQSKTAGNLFVTWLMGRFKK